MCYSFVGFGDIISKKLLRASLFLLELYRKNNNIFIYIIDILKIFGKKVLYLKV